MVKPDYWDVTDARLVEKTGHPGAHWRAVLDALGARGLKSGEVVDRLQGEHAVPRYWARTITTWYLKQAD